MAVLGANSPEWFSCAVGAVMAGGVVSPHNCQFNLRHHHHNCHCHIHYDDDEQVTGVYTTNTTEAVRYQLKHSMANIAVVDGRAQLEKVSMMMMMLMTMMSMMSLIVLLILHLYLS